MKELRFHTKHYPHSCSRQSAEFRSRVLLLLARLICIGCSIILIGAAFTGCSRRSFTKPRSQIIEEALSNGKRAISIAEDRRRFFQHEYVARDRLQKLLATRRRLGISRASYRLGPADEFELNVFDVPELNVTVRVRDSGFISLPLIGAVRAGGKTEEDLQRELVAKLARFVKDPELSIYVTEYGSQKVSVMGAVAQPGTYSLRKGSNSIVELLGQAGGITEQAGNQLNFVPIEVQSQLEFASNDVRARLSRRRFNAAPDQGGGVSSQGIDLYLSEVLGTGGSIPLDIPVRGGDMIIVPEAGTVLVTGEVEQRGSYELGKRMTLLGALAAAGGIRYSAKFDEVEVIRSFSPTRKARLVVNLEDVRNGNEEDINLQNGDLVRVPSDSGRRMTSDTFDGLAQLINVGGTVSVVP